MADLRDYVQHKPECERIIGTRYVHSGDWGELSFKYRRPGDNCTCGLADLLALVEARTPAQEKD